MPECDGHHPAPPPKAPPPPVQEGHPANSAGGAANATAATPRRGRSPTSRRGCSPTPRRVRSPTLRRSRDEDDPPDGGSEHDGYSVPGTWPTNCNSQCAFGDVPHGEIVMPDTVQGPILVLPDENPPLEYDYELPVLF